MEAKKVFEMILTKDANPPKWGWYYTDNGKIFWYELEQKWSCRDDRVSEEYPQWWLKEVDVLTGDQAIELIRDYTKDVFGNVLSDNMIKYIKNKLDQCKVPLKLNEWVLEMIEAMRIFVARVDKGEIRSKKTYTQFRELLNKFDNK